MVGWIRNTVLNPLYAKMVALILVFVFQSKAEGRSREIFE
jgi:hypothetical protein